MAHCYKNKSSPLDPVWSKWIRSIISRRNYSKPILILYSHRSGFKVFLLKLYLQFSSLQCMLHVPRTTTSLILITVIIFGEEYKLRDLHFLQPPGVSSLLTLNSLLRILFQTPEYVLFINMKAHVPRSYEITNYIKFFIFLDRRSEVKYSEMKVSKHSAKII